MNLRNYILENQFKMIYLSNKLDIVNYIDISHFDSNKIIINYNEGSVLISGKSLVVSKLVSDELLIEGSINKIVCYGKESLCSQCQQVLSR